VLPVRDGDVQYLKYSLPAAIHLSPTEILLVMDAHEEPTQESTAIRVTAQSIVERKGYDGLRFLEVAPKPNSHFKQGSVRRHGYLAARYDTQFTFDCDDIPYQTVMNGLDYIGKDNVAFVTFRKQLVREGLVRSVRTWLYERHLDKNVQFILSRTIGSLRARRKRALKQYPKPFIGIYWMYRPWYLDLVREEEISRIYNGEDTFIQYALARQTRYKHIHLDVDGCRSLRDGNEDLPWRQYELGIWLGCMEINHARSPNLLQNAYYATAYFQAALQQMCIRGHPRIMQGYSASKHLSHTLRKQIAAMSYPEFIMYGQGLVKLR